MIKAYVAGAYSGRTREETEANIQRAAEVAKVLWSWGFAVFCPHKNSAHFDDVAAYDVFIRGDLAWLQHADILVLTPGYENSGGTKQEIEFCIDNGIPVYLWDTHKQAIRELLEG